jgi:hypothetical protein
LIGGVHAETSCLEVSRQVSERYESVAARYARAPVRLGLPTGQGGPDSAIGSRPASAAPKEPRLGCVDGMEPEASVAAVAGAAREAVCGCSPD